MAESPVIYVLNGEDEFALSEFVNQEQAKLGEGGMMEMNTSQLDGRSATFDQLVNAASAMPFLAKRRLVLLSNPLGMAKTAPARQKFLDFLAKVPPSTALLLIEPRLLTEDRERRSGKVHWLETWAQSAGERVLLRTFAMPTGAAMVDWILKRAVRLGGRFSREAAEKLADQLGDEPRLADQEIQKLLVYVNAARPVEADDVEHLTPSVRQGDIFAMVDALGSRQGRQAQEMLHRLLEDQEAMMIFIMVVRQFRLLLLAREVLDGGKGEAEISRATGLQGFAARKLIPQARYFTLPALEAIYHRLLELDEAIKTGQIEVDVALDVLVAGLAAS